MIGQTLSHYQILEKLGEGGMGVVYKAQDTKLDRFVALKFLPANLSSSGDDKARFLQEAKAASALNHPNVCTIYDIQEENAQQFIVMEFVDGATLKQNLPIQKLQDALTYAIQIGEALHEAHVKGIVHRDVKCDNIMVNSKNQIKVMDFGLAKLKGSLKYTTTVSTAGTLAYMAPEQIQGGETDARSDIFSFGVVLFEILTGHMPFRGDHGAAMMYSIVNEEPESVQKARQDISADVDRIIHRALEKNPEDRYQHIDEMLVDLRSAQQGIPAAPTPQRKAQQLPLLIGGGIAVVALTIFIYIFLFPKTTPPGEKSIAVLPFQNFTPEGPHSYFASGLHDELLTQLSKVGALKVISRTSVMGYEGTRIPLRQIARELGVGNVVEGSVQVVGDRLRVNVQLIDAATDAHLWAERYDRTLDDAFAIQSEVAQRIVAAVGGALTSAEKGKLTAAPTANAEAYRLFLQGREYFGRPGYLMKNLETAAQLYERALALDPGFALAHAELSVVHGYIYWFRYDPSPARVDREREEAEAALRLAPDLPQAHIAIGLHHYRGQRDYQRALDEFAIALRDLPNDASLWSDIGYVHRRLGNWDKVFDAFGKATQLNPRDADLFWDLGADSYDFVRRYAEAVSAYDRALSLVPHLFSAAMRRGLTYMRWRGQLDTLQAVFSSISGDPDLADKGELEARRADLQLWERNSDRLLLVLQNAHVAVFDYQEFFIPAALYAAWAHLLHGDRPAAHVAFESSQVLLDSVMKKLPDDWRVHAARGLTLAGLNRRDEALREARWLKESEVYRGDFYEGKILGENRAMIFAQAGDAEDALDEIERLLAGPSQVSVHTLRLDPRWDPIRDHPRFKALLTRYAER